MNKEQEHNELLKYVLIQVSTSQELSGKYNKSLNFYGMVFKSSHHLNDPPEDCRPSLSLELFYAVVLLWHHTTGNCDCATCTWFRRVSGREVEGSLGASMYTWTNKQTAAFFYELSSSQCSAGCWPPEGSSKLNYCVI